MPNHLHRFCPSGHDKDDPDVGRYRTRLWRNVSGSVRSKRERYCHRCTRNRDLARKLVRWYLSTRSICPSPHT